MQLPEYEKRIADLEKEKRILQQKLIRSEANRVMLEEALETHSHALKVRNAELEESREKIKKSEEKYKELAHHDILTELPNRACFYECLHNVLSCAKRSETCVALLYLDLDRFKEINDKFGHETGDAVLRQTAERLLSCIRCKDIVARIGGDEFVVLLTDIFRYAVVMRIAKRIIKEISKPYLIDDVSCGLGISIGISLYPGDAEDPEKLLQKADIAMYNAKKDNCSKCCFYREIKQYINR